MVTKVSVLHPEPVGHKLGSSAVSFSLTVFLFTFFLHKYTCPHIYTF